MVRRKCMPSWDWSERRSPAFCQLRRLAATWKSIFPPTRCSERPVLTTRILAVAVNTVRRKMHERLLYIFLMFVFALIAGSVLISKLTLGDGGRLILNLGIAAVNLFGVFMAVFVGMALVHDEIEKKTLYAVLSKPVSRQEFVLGKFFGLVTTLSIVVW